MHSNMDTEENNCTSSTEELFADPLMCPYMKTLTSNNNITNMATSTRNSRSGIIVEDSAKQQLNGMDFSTSVLGAAGKTALTTNGQNFNGYIN